MVSADKSHVGCDAPGSIVTYIACDAIHMVIGRSAVGCGYDHCAASRGAAYVIEAQPPVAGIRDTGIKCGHIQLRGQCCVGVVEPIQLLIAVTGLEW